MNELGLNNRFQKEENGEERGWEKKDEAEEEREEKDKSKWLVQDHIANRVVEWYTNPGSFTPKPIPFLLCHADEASLNEQISSLWIVFSLEGLPPALTLNLFLSTPSFIPNLFSPHPVWPLLHPS